VLCLLTRVQLITREHWKFTYTNTHACTQYLHMHARYTHAHTRTHTYLHA
jgi:hypothetical protein